jgi:hypothetical protein
LKLATSFTGHREQRSSFSTPLSNYLQPTNADVMRIESPLRTIVCSVLLLPGYCVFGFDFRLTTKAKNPLGNAAALQDYLSRPVHWPQIVSSSDKVESGNSSFNVTDSMKPGQSVDELFGMGLLRVAWTCREANPGRFVVVSSDGVPGIATCCSMEFDIRDDIVDLTMGYTPASLVAYLATPALVVDNWLALHVWLPAAIDPTPLDSYRRLMGVLYGVAGLAHAVDLCWGGSVLFASIGLPPFADLPIEGRAYAALWCAVGPLSYYLSSRAANNGGSSSARLGDLGIFLYGFVEVLGALLSGDQRAWTNAIGVQVVVFAAWLYSNQKQASLQN